MSGFPSRLQLELDRYGVRPERARACLAVLEGIGGPGGVGTAFLRGRTMLTRRRVQRCLAQLIRMGMVLRDEDRSGDRGGRCVVYYRTVWYQRLTE